MTPELVSHNGLTLNLAEIKCIKCGDYFEGKNFQMIVIFKTRYEFLKHPKTGKYFKQKFNETVSFDFPDFETAVTVIGEWREIWDKYLYQQWLKK